MKTIIRGGQLFLHNARMLRQVLCFVVLLPIFLGAILNIILAYKTLDTRQADIIKEYSIAKFFINIKQYDVKIPSLNYDGVYTHGRMPIDRLGNKQVAVFQKDPLTIIKYRGLEWFEIKRQLLRNLYISSIPAFITFIFTTCICYMYGTRTRDDHVIQGKNVVTSKELNKQISKDNKKKQYQAYTLASIPYPAEGEYRHTLITGSTGTGKTLLISDLVTQIRKRGDRAIIYDKTGVYTERFFKKGDILLNPLDQRGATWNILQEVKDEEDFYNIAASLIPMSNRTEDKFWISAARTVFAEICGKLWKSNPHATNAELVNILLKQSKSYIEKYLQNTTATNLISGDGNKTAESILGIMSNFTHCLKYLPDGELFSIGKWMQQESDSILFLTSHNIKHNAIIPLLVGWLELSITHMLSKKSGNKQKTWFIIDEASSLHRVPGLANALSLARQYGGCFVLGIQSIHQLHTIYGNEANTIDDLCNNKIILQIAGNISAEHYSKVLGEMEIEKTTEGISYGANTMRDGVNISMRKERKRIVSPTAITELKVREGYIKFGNTYPVAKINVPIVEYEAKNEQMIARKVPDKVDTIINPMLSEDDPKEDNKTSEESTNNKSIDPVENSNSINDNQDHSKIKLKLTDCI